MAPHPERLRDRVVTGDYDSFREMLKGHEETFRTVVAWIAATNVPRDARSVVLSNLLWAAANYLNISRSNAGDGHISVIALVTRSLYELRLRVEYIIREPQELDMWQAEAAVDQIQVLEGILKIDRTTTSEEQCRTLRTEITRLRALLRKHGMKEPKHLSSSFEIAKKLGRANEHQSLFKLYSKLVHPSSYLVNNYAQAGSRETVQILEIHLQPRCFLRGGQLQAAERCGTATDRFPWKLRIRLEAERAFPAARHMRSHSVCVSPLKTPTLGTNQCSAIQLG